MSAEARAKGAPGAGPELAPQFDPAAIETPLYKEWLERGLFAPDAARGARPFVIVMPPPNVTGVLHMGHGLDNTVQDVLVRFERMRGREALWLPGTDHAGIATQNVVEKQLAREGKTRFDVGREEFVARVWDFVGRTGTQILEQLKAIGCSCDWTRTRFTLEPALSRAVREVFVRLWEDGLVYRGHRVIHWCPRCHTSLSDEEAEHRDMDGRLYHIRYPLEGGGFVTVATTRPETMLGDVAVAVHPADESKRHLVGKRVILPIAEIPLPVIADQSVELGFGSGFLKVTPAHDPVDFETGRRHGLPMPVVMTEDARMADASLEGREGGRVPAPLFGQDRFEAREQIVELLRQRRLLERIENHRHAVRHCYRCGTVVEPRLSDQWFVRMQPLAEPALAAYRDGAVRFIPERRGEEYQQWLTGIRDWNISRQLWWGHRIPVWYCDACGTSKAYREDPTACEQCGGPLRQDEDVLDTWFSSWLWPFSTLGWPERTQDLARYYPGDVLVTGPEILFFWVARMIMAGLRFMNRVPFHTVYLHGTARDTQHRRMSKSLGNGIDPLDVVRLYGADALRFTLVSALAVGTDIVMDPTDLETTFASGRNFANKLWNMGRLVVGNLTGDRVADLQSCSREDLALADRWILSRLSGTVRQATEHMEKFRLNDAVGAPYHFLWDEFADWWLEQAKPRLRGEAPGGDVARAVAVHCFGAALKLLHPTMPFITEALYRRLPGNAQRTIVSAPWPVPEPEREDTAAEEDFEILTSWIGAVRTIRAEYGVRPGQPVRSAIVAQDERPWRIVQSELAMAKTLTRSQSIGPAAPSGPAAFTVIAGGATAAVALGGAVDVERECERLGRELSRLDQQLAGLRRKLDNEGFTARAPAEVVAREREKEREWSGRRETLAGKLRALGCP